MLMGSDSSPIVIKHPGPNPEWLAKLSEDVLEPELPIVDPHHHFWDHPGNPYLLDDFLADRNSGHNVVATVYMQVFWAHRGDGPASMRPIGETEAVMSVVEEAKRRGIRARIAAGIVGYAELALGADVEPVLAAQLEAGAGRFRGIRNIAARHPKFVASITTPPAFGLMRSEAFREGFALLDKFGLSFDAWLYYTQVDQLLGLARQFPQTPIVFNHAGGPLGFGPYRGRRNETFSAWREAMRCLAVCPNVYMKLGGLGMISTGFDFHENVLPPSSGELATAWAPYIETLIEIFGVDRCMFESNFPVDKNSFSYSVLWNAFKRLARGASAEEKRALFHDTATRFYRLGI
jgi:predicted TIM-barrel fold metal-dependent hydrolase